jgi:hypothetical protein
MPLTLQQVKDLIIAGRPEWIKQSEKESLKYNVHFNGIGVAEYLTPNAGFENKHQLEARKNLVTSNRFLFENLTRPIDKVFSATGGNNVYPKGKEQLTKTVSNIRHGYSVKRWIEKIQANKYYTDPNGLVLFEWDESTTYPTVKSVGCIFNYETSGRDVQWVIFNPENKNDGEYWRVIDEQFDYTYLRKGDSLTLVEDKTFINPFGKCPAIVNSDLVHFELNRKDSPFAPVMEIADHYLRTGSVKNIYENYHGYPIFWAYGQPCKRCKGEGHISDGGVLSVCPSCDGTGNTLRKDVTDVINLKPPVNDQPKLAPDIAGYVQPDLETWREQRVELDWLWQQMHFTIWGTSYQRDQETATASYIDAQPVNDRLTQFSESFEDMEQKMTELVSLYFYQTANDISINWGKRFMIEKPEAIWNKYIGAKEKGAPKTALDYLLTQFYQTEYANDNERLVTSMKLIQLEPFIHCTDKEVIDNGITGSDLIAKLYFNEWVKELETGYIFVTDIKKLHEEFEKWVEEKEIEIEDDKTPEIPGTDNNVNNQENEQVQTDVPSPSDGRDEGI